MLKYTLKRILLLIPTLLVILTIVFILIRIVPGSPVYALLEGEDNVTPEMVEELETEMGFNDPLIVQYGRYIRDIFTGNWGESYFNNKDVFANILAVWEPSILITVYAPTQMPVGMIETYYKNPAKDALLSKMEKLPQDSAEYLEKWNQLAEMMVEDCASVMLGTIDWFWYHPDTFVSNDNGLNRFLFNSYWKDPENHQD